MLGNFLRKAILSLITYIRKGMEHVKTAMAHTNVMFDRLTARMEEVRVIQKQLEEKLAQDESQRLRNIREHANTKPRIVPAMPEDRFLFPGGAREAQVKFNKACEKIRDASDIYTMEAVLNRALKNDDGRPKYNFPDRAQPSRKKYEYK